MRQALGEARKAFEAEEVPIGAVVVSGGRVVGRGHNLVETLGDPTAHAEMQALTAAASTLGGKYLPDCTLYVTVAVHHVRRGDRLGSGGAGRMGRRRCQEGLPPLFGVGFPSENRGDARRIGC